MTHLTPVATAISKPMRVDGKLQNVERRFTFATPLSLADLMVGDKIRPVDIPSVKPGEVMEIHGPSYIRTFRLVSKVNEFVDLERIGSEDGPDPIRVFPLQIAAGEVQTRWEYPEELASAIMGGRMAVSSNDCDVPYALTLDEQGILLDIAVADFKPTDFTVRVYP